MDVTIATFLKTSFRGISTKYQRKKLWFLVNTKCRNTTIWIKAQKISLKINLHSHKSKWTSRKSFLFSFHSVSNQQTFFDKLTQYDLLKYIHESINWKPSIFSFSAKFYFRNFKLNFHTKTVYLKPAPDFLKWPQLSHYEGFVETNSYYKDIFEFQDPFDITPASFRN